MSSKHKSGVTAAYFKLVHVPMLVCRHSLQVTGRSPYLLGSPLSVACETEAGTRAVLQCRITIANDPCSNPLEATNGARSIEFPDKDTSSFQRPRYRDRRRMSKRHCNVLPM